MRAAVVVLAAGAGTRVGAEVEQGAAAAGRHPRGRPLGPHRARGARGRADRAGRARRRPGAVREAVEPSPRRSWTGGRDGHRRRDPASVRVGRPQRPGARRSRPARSTSWRCTTPPARWPLSRSTTPSSTPRRGVGGAIPVARLHDLRHRRRLGAARGAGRRADAPGVPRPRPAAGATGGAPPTASRPPTPPRSWPPTPTSTVAAVDSDEREPQAHRRRRLRGRRRRSSAR